MSRLMSVARIEEKAVWAMTENCRHKTSLPDRPFLAKRNSVAKQHYHTPAILPSASPSTRIFRQSPCITAPSAS